MNLFAASATSGVGGTTFLAFYLALAVAVLGLAVVKRRRLLAGPATVRATDLSAAQAAYLGGGARLAVVSALAALRQAGAVAIGPAPDRHLVVAGDRPIDASPLESAVYRAAGQRLSLPEVGYDNGVSAELARLRADLERAGLLPGDEVRRGLRVWSRALLAVLLLGVLWLFAGLANGMSLLPGMLVLVPFSLASTMLRKHPDRTRAGTRVLADLRQQYIHLAPAYEPSWSTYGPAGAAMGVAVFGPAALWTADPEFAAQAEIQQRLGVGSGGSSSYGGGGGDGGSSGGGYCGGPSGDSGGGGSCGGGSSGGSSCGGGGGCGGGSGG